MKIVVIGGTGLIGSKLVRRFEARGHEAVAASPNTGVNTLTGEGLAEVLRGAAVVVDVSNSPSFEDAAVLDFFETSTGNVLEAEKTAGVGHHVALSIVGTDRLPGNGYFSRARRQVTGERRAPVSTDEQRRLLSAFVGAARSGDLAALEELFSADVTSCSDGGGVVRASRFEVHGSTRVARYVRAFKDRFWVDMEVELSSANGQPAALLRRHGVLEAVLLVDASEEGIEQILWVMNPHKLTALS